MMLDAIGVTVAYPRLLSVLDIRPWGTPHRNIRRLIEIVPDIQVTYKQGELSDLYRALDGGSPPVAFVWTAELPYWSIGVWHAIVLVGYDEHNLYVNDPGFDDAPQSLKPGEFDLAWQAHDSYYALAMRAQ